MTFINKTFRQAIFDLRRFLRIAHHVSGRVRLRLDPRALDLLPGVSQAALVFPFSRLDGIRDVRVNVAAFSVAIHYDPAVIAPGWWETLVRGDDDAVAGLFDRFQNLWSEPVAAWQQEIKVSREAA